MRVSLQRSYRSKNGNPVFVYTVNGSKADLKQFKTIQAEYYREDEKSGTPLWFTTRCIGQAGTLIITENNKIVPDMSAFDQAKSLVEQYGGNFGAELAKGAVANLLGGANNSAQASPQTAPQDADAEGMGGM